MKRQRLSLFYLKYLCIKICIYTYKNLMKRDHGLEKAELGGFGGKIGMGEMT